MEPRSVSLLSFCSFFQMHSWLCQWTVNQASSHFPNNGAGSKAETYHRYVSLYQQLLVAIFSSPVTPSSDFLRNWVTVPGSNGPFSWKVCRVRLGWLLWGPRTGLRVCREKGAAPQQKQSRARETESTRLLLSSVLFSLAVLESPAALLPQLGETTWLPWKPVLLWGLLAWRREHSMAWTHWHSNILAYRPTEGHTSSTLTQSRAKHPLPENLLPGMWDPREPI